MKKKIVVLGAGESGTGSAVLAMRQGFDVFVSDMGLVKEDTGRYLKNIILSGRRESIPGKQSSPPMK